MTEANPIDQTREETSPQLPSDALIIFRSATPFCFRACLAVRHRTTASVAGAQQAVREQRQVGILLQRSRMSRNRAGRHAPMVSPRISCDTLHPDGTHHLVCHGERAFKSGIPRRLAVLVARVLAISGTAVRDAVGGGRGPLPSS